MGGVFAFCSFDGKLRSCDVYIGVPGSAAPLARFVKWMRAELELQGFSCFVVDRSKCKDAISHNAVERAMSSATYGMVIVSENSFSNPYSMYELKCFLGKKKLVPIFFGLSPGDCVVEDVTEKRGELWVKHGGDLWRSYGGKEEEWKEALNALARMEGWKLEARGNNWRSCVYEALLLLGMRLGRRSVVERVETWKKAVESKEFPFHRNEKFVGRKRELLELELMLFDGVDHVAQNERFELEAMRSRSKLLGDPKSKRNAIVDKIKSKGKELATRKQFEENVEMQGGGSLRKWILMNEHKEKLKKKASSSVANGKGVACISGEPGIGKTELLLEFCYRHAQRYKTVLWVGGEAKYMRQNFINLFSLLDVDASIENQLFHDAETARSFEELEGESIRRLRKEFMRDIPFLIVIDNLEREQDWWDAKSIMELLPRFGGETHVLMSTRLPRVMNLELMKLSCLSGSESMALMRGSTENIPIGETAALRIIEEKLDRLTFGLALVGGLLSEFHISPHTLLESINKMPFQDLIWTRGEDGVLRRNPFLTRLIEVSLFIVNHVDKAASGMALASGWFAPAPIPVSVLSLASTEAVGIRRLSINWKNFLGVLTCCWFSPYPRRSVVESSALLVRLGFARNPTKEGYIDFHEIIKLYARKRGDTQAAYAMFRAINSRGSLSEHNEHVWATCFLILKFGTQPAILKPKISELVSFIKRFALPLAVYTFTNASRCNAALELMRQCTDALEVIEESLLSKMGKTSEKSFQSRMISVPPTGELYPALYQELILLKATLLETRGKILLQSGELEIGDELCRTSIWIREVIHGEDRQGRISSSNKMDELLRSEAARLVN
ncbi:hypothetical protein Sjap_012619 [Stephania japonica]|uniref:TIR domain-containing protein n=1 Tax=Stephania japonica TaxID=461633 RepID=A0AAP0IYB4_9MAGN